MNIPGIKRRVISIVFICVFVISGYTQSDVKPIGYDVFYKELAPYGQWINSPSYGGYVWVPAAGAGFYPYATNGHWAYSDYGWTWISDFSWGWCAFHYGRWDYDSFVGWLWIPGEQWAPAWVVWVSLPGYYGWAPMGYGYNVHGGYSHSRIPPQRYKLVKNKDFTAVEVYKYCVLPSENINLLSKASFINDQSDTSDGTKTFYKGPSQKDVEERSGRPVKKAVIKPALKPQQDIDDKGIITNYRPDVIKPSKLSTLAPATVYKMEQVDPIDERSVKTHPTPYKP